MTLRAGTVDTLNREQMMQRDDERPRVLLMAYECAPNQGSEREIGWHRVVQAARACEVHAIVSAESYMALTFVEQAGELPPHIHFYTPPPDRKFERLGRLPVLFAYNYQAYRHWQLLAYRLAGQLHARHPFALVHQVTGTGFREPGFTWQMGIPFLWGPVGGTQNFPPAFLAALSLREAWKERIRTWVNRRSLRFKPRVRQAAAHATAIFAANSTNRRDLEAALNHPVELLAATGLERLPPVNEHRYEPGSPLRILWAGDLEARKALPLLLEALAKVQDCVDFELQILGKGPQAQEWKALARKLGIASHCTFFGHVSLADATAHQSWAQLFAFTSLRDTSASLMLESMGAGVPVLCFDHQSGHDLVTPECGILLPVTDPKTAVTELAATLLDLSRHPKKLRAMSDGARRQAEKFLWSVNGDRMNAVYRECAQLPARTELQRVPG